MKTVAKFEFPTSTFGQSTHEWDAILAAEVPVDQLGKPGKAVVLIEGDDFTSDPTNFTMMIRAQAEKRHLHCKVSKVVATKEGEKTKIYVQVAKMNDADSAEVDAKLEAKKEGEKTRRLNKKAKAGEPAAA